MIQENRFPRIISEDYDLWTDPIEERKVMGGRVVHRTLIVHFRHKRTKDQIIIRMTGRGSYYTYSSYSPKEERIAEYEVQETFNRLVGKDGDMAFRIARVRLYMEAA